MQTLTTLNLGGEGMGNYIGSSGAKHVANVLRVNQVIEIVFWFVSFSSFFYTDAHDTQSWR